MTFPILMAWRDSRRQRSRLLLCALSLVFGVAALVAVNSFADNLRAAMEKEARALLGADLQVTSRTPFTPETEAYLEQLGGELSREIRFSTMALFPSAGETRLVQVRAIDGGFPFYGTFETRPAGANPAQGDNAVAVVDPLLMAQYELQPGDTVRLGDTLFTISAEIVRVPGEAAFAGLFAPRLYIPLSQLEDTGLMGRGSIAFYRATLRLPPDLDPEAVKAALTRDLPEDRLRVETVDDRKQDLGRSLENLQGYLGLVGFIALLLGGAGIAGSVQIYLREKRDTVAILRCLGSSSRTAFTTFVIQIMAIALVGTLLGAFAGITVQNILPRLMAPLIPFQIDIFLSWSGILTGILFGLVTALLCSLFPLLPLRRISPLRALRSAYTSHSGKRDPLLLPLALLSLAVFLGFCAGQTPVRWHGLAFAGGLLIALGLLWLGAHLLKLLLKYHARPRLFTLRQGLANLHRPENRTALLTMILGVGVFLMQTLTLTENGLLQETRLSSDDQEPNLLFFDIQPDQKEDLYAIVQNQGMSIIEDAPVVTMRLSEIRGRSVSSIRQDPANSISEWILNREWRSAYRKELGPSETITAGTFTGSWHREGEPIPVSLEAGIAADLGVGLNDTLVFDVQGIPLTVIVTSLREVEWRRMRPNFFVVFPEGVLEEAPGWWIAVTRSPDHATTAFLQRRIFEAHPNISAVDLSVIIEAVQRILGRVNFAVRFMALFSLATGIIILAATLVAGRHQRIRESILLRTLGASGNQIRGILAVEYLVLGTLAALVGTLLAVAAGAALSHWVFETSLTIPWPSLMAAIPVAAALTLITGLASSRGIASHPPLEVLREN